MDTPRLVGQSHNNHTLFLSPQSFDFYAEELQHGLVRPSLWKSSKRRISSALKPRSHLFPRNHLGREVGRARSLPEPPSSPIKFRASPAADSHSGLGTTPVATQAADGASGSAQFPAGSSSSRSGRKELDDLERLGLERYMTSISTEEQHQETKSENLSEPNGTLHRART